MSFNSQLNDDQKTSYSCDPYKASFILHVQTLIPGLDVTSSSSLLDVMVRALLAGPDVHFKDGFRLDTIEKLLLLETTMIMTMSI